MTITKTAATKAWSTYANATEEARWRKSRGAPLDVVQRAEWRAAEAHRRYARVHEREVRLYGCVRECCATRAA